MRLEFMVLALIGAGLGAASAWGQTTYTTFGDGNLSCGTWTADRLGGQPVADFDEEWVMGYVSAFNEALSEKNGKSVEMNTDANGIFGWIDNYCKANPTNSIAVATETFWENSGTIMKTSN